MRLSQSNDPQAYEKLVDDLLRRPSYGEHWARMWLDLARYADSAGYADDPPRTIWAYRDWVIKAIQRQQAVRSIHDRADCRRLVAQSDRRATDRHGLPSQHADQQRRRHAGRRVSQRGRRRSGEHDDGGVDGNDDGMCSMPHPQVRSDLAARVLSVVRHPEQHAGRRSHRRIARAADLHRRATTPADRVAKPASPCCRRFWRRPATGSCSVQAAWAASSKLSLHALKPATTVPILRELTGQRRETRLAISGQLSRQGPCGRTGIAGRVSCRRRRPAARPLEVGTLAGRQRQSPHGARHRQSVLGDAVRSRHRADERGIRIARRAADSSRAVGLAGDRSSWTAAGTPGR